MTLLEQTPRTRRQPARRAAPPPNAGLRFSPGPGGRDGYDGIEWTERDPVIKSHDGTVVFSQPGVEFPSFWSENAVQIVAQKYFRGELGSPERERSLRQLIDRMVDTITEWGIADGYFGGEDAVAFAGRLRELLVRQKAAFNSPVWFNIGVPGVEQQASACFILSVEDTMEDILGWYVREGRIFKRGSGSGVNLSALRAAGEPLSGGGEASGPVTFMRGADASAGTIRSGGKTRRAAKMVLLDVDHPDVEAFVWCKAKEERKARALEAAGFDMSFDGDDAASIQYQNANNSVRLTDAFMKAAQRPGAAWTLRGRASDLAVERDASELLDSIAQAAWECADPGVHYSDTITRWHTIPNAGPIRASNPCSEYLSIDDSACNLASLNLVAFLDGHRFDIEGFRDAVRTMTVAQDILVDRADYPTELIGRKTRRYRQLGLGFSNLGGALMRLGLPYDSDAGREWAAVVTALMGGTAYETSGEIAALLGPFAGFDDDSDAMRRVLDRHRSEAARLQEIVDLNVASAAAAVHGFTYDPASIAAAARAAWEAAVEHAAGAGVRNSQATVLAPTGTISFAMDCCTTGIEPAFSLVASKKLAGGGSMVITNQSVPAALDRLAYSDDAAERIMDHLVAGDSITTAPGLHPAHLDVFACASGGGPVVSPDGHLKMMAACQPFLSGAISKTVNVPEDTTAAQLREMIVAGWQLGLKAVAFYRENCKVSQPLTAAGSDKDGDETAKLVIPTVEIRQAREPLPRERRSRTISFRVSDCHCYMTVGEYEDGRPGEIFFTVSKQGSTLAGIMDCFGISVSHGLQHGVPLRSYVEAFSNVQFEPRGLTDDPELRIASSLVDYVFRRLALDYLDADERAEMGVLSVAERTSPTLPGVAEAAEQTVQSRAMVAPLCMTCGNSMIRAGSCYACRDCGTTSGCG